jgi:hypothetical protein
MKKNGKQAIVVIVRKLSRKSAVSPTPFLCIEKSSNNPSREEVKKAAKFRKLLVFKSASASSKELAIIPDKVKCYDPSYHEVIIRGSLADDPRQRVVIAYATSGSELYDSKYAGTARLVPGRPQTRSVSSPS